MLQLHKLTGEDQPTRGDALDQLAGVKCLRGFRFAYIETLAENRHRVISLHDVSELDRPGGELPSSVTRVYLTNDMPLLESK